jgi:replication fork clamp-binding protein CrfC
VLSELEDLSRRLEQQISSYEKLHADEMKRFEEELAAYRRLQNDELQMLRDELKQLKDEIEGLSRDESPSASAPSAGPAEPPAAYVDTTVTRRELLTGKIPLASLKRI